MRAKTSLDRDVTDLVSCQEHMEGDGAPDNTPFDVYVNPRVANAVATKCVLKIPRPPEHPDGPGTVDIEVDTASLKAPILPVVMLVGGYDLKQAGAFVNRLLNDPKRERIRAQVGPLMRLNNRGHACYCAEGQVMHKILMCLPPSRCSDEYMHECARVLWMRDTGDQQLIDEVHNNRTTAITNGGVPTMGSLFGPPTVEFEPERLPLAVCRSDAATDLGSYTDDHVLLDLMLTLEAATGWDRLQALETWLGLCETHPIFMNCWLCVNTQTAYVQRGQLFNITTLLPPVEWAACVADFLVHSPPTEFDPKDALQLLPGSFYPTIKWTPPRDYIGTTVVWTESFVGDQSTAVVDFDMLLQSKYSLSAKQATSLRYRHRATDNDFAAFVHKAIDTQGAVRWFAPVIGMSRFLQKFSAQRNAEAERMHEHRLAQIYVESRVCEVEVLCPTCGSVDVLDTQGRLVREYPWRGFTLDIGFVLGDEVVAAVEILKTSAVTAKKLREIVTEGLPFAEVRATDVLCACRDKVTVVRALRGNGVCKSCKHTESCASLVREMAACDEKERAALKRSAETMAELAELSVRKEDIRAKLRRLVA